MSMDDEFNKLKKKVESVRDGLKEAYKKGRRDAIREVIRIIDLDYQGGDLFWNIVIKRDFYKFKNRLKKLLNEEKK